jgi:hypothetical protein
VQYQTISRSKGLIEVDTDTGKPMYARGISGLALEDLSTRSPPETVLEGSDFRSWLKYRSTSLKWLHRSAYDYISGDIEADLPAWAQVVVDKSMDMLSGCVWLQKYGLSVWTYSSQSDMYLHSEARPCAVRIINVVQSRGEASPDDGYKALDNVLSGLSSLYSDRWLQLYPNGQSRSSCAMLRDGHFEFWSILVIRGYTDYMISRFEWFKRCVCAHCVSFHFLQNSFNSMSELGDTLAALILDYLTTEIHADTTIATAALPNLHENNWVNSAFSKMYCFAVFNRSGVRNTISWLSHGEYDEKGDIKMHVRSLRDLSYAMMSRSVSPGITSKINHLSDLWQLSCQSQPVTQRDAHRDVASTH